MVYEDTCIACESNGQNIATNRSIHTKDTVSLIISLLC